MATTSTILMVRPAAFGYNAETATNNFFQQKGDKPVAHIQQEALAEFDNMVKTLRQQKINVIVVEDSASPMKPDAIFPNNWFCTSPQGKIDIFPMYAANRRLEKREDILQKLSRDFKVSDVQDWSEFEAEGRFLEGTGSMIIDYDNELIYAAISERTNLSVLEKFAVANQFQAVVFLAKDETGQAIYHTNVMMALGEKFCILCEEAIEEEWELIAVRQLLASTGHEIIPITQKQMNRFAGNMLEVQNTAGKRFLIMSQSAHEALDHSQKQKLKNYCTLLPIPIGQIEEAGGGSVRCMMAEIFLPSKK
ncbi:MAG TPA: arginine deiminase-related protein [Chitinophagaceae bacterium]|nr:amidinotransferase [Chitinophagaceae bacterium]HQU55900.1 arginine deiminase-related protein [Chitinophagaceae bacterium]